MEAKRCFFVLNQDTQQFEKKYFSTSVSLNSSNSSNRSLPSSGNCTEARKKSVELEGIESMEFVPFELPF